jgi:hypothetical protein|tara:strand:+ start:340 stop:1047 length:708 start_codon:yes stop_codon:yes gene_type:complete
MGIKDNFEKSLNKAIEGKDKIFYKSLLKNAKDIEEKIEMKTHKGKSCKEAHPGVTHSKWKKQTEGEVEEATTSASAGAFMAPLGVDPRFKKKKKEKKEEFDEATTSASAGQYVTPQMWAKDEKNWRGKAKTQWPGGKFVKIKDKCKTFPYCNQGDINALDLTENNKIKNAIIEVSKKTGKDKSYIKELVKKDLEEIIRRSIYKSPITSMLGPKSKMNTPIGKIFSMGSNVGGKYE